MNGLEMHAPKLDDPKQQVRVNMYFRGEPAAWKRTTPAKYGRWRLVDPAENVKAKKYLVQQFNRVYRKWKPIERRRLGVQIFFQTLVDSKDADNMAKLVLDAFNGKIWTDDRQIKELYVRVNVATRTPYTQLAVYVLEVGA